MEKEAGNTDPSQSGDRIRSGRKTSDTLLRASALIKRFGSVTAVDGVSFDVRRGEIFGFLGPNGAGKTTTINLLTGLAKPTAGIVSLEGLEYSRNPKPAQASMGIVGDESNLYEELDGFDNLCFCGALYGMEKKVREMRATELLKQFGLEEAESRPFRAYSKGMKRRLTIAAAIIHRPAVLFLDEPTTGIDVASARQVRTLIADLNRAGTTVFLTTHYIEEAQRLCHRIAFIVRGKIVRIGTLGELIAEHQRKFVLELVCEETQAKSLDTLRARFSQYEVSRADDKRVRVISEGPVELLPLLTSVADVGITVTEAKLIRPSLEEVFVEVTGIESGIMKQERERKK